MTPAALAAGSLLILLTCAAALTAFRRRYSLKTGEAHPQNVFPGLRWHAAIRALTVIIALVLLSAITVADPAPLVDRLFPTAEPGAATLVVLAFHEVLATAVCGIAIVALLADLAVTFVRPTVLRRMLMSVLTVGAAGCAAYGGLFVVALAIS